MSKFIFIDPTQAKCMTTGEKQYDPVNRPWDFSCIPEGRGVYIWGMKVKVNGATYFAPWCVGEGRLRERIETHYFGLCSRGSYKEELFDFSQDEYSISDIRRLYQAMNEYDHKVRKAGKSDLKSGKFPKLDAACLIDRLIFWQDNRFLHHKSTGTYKGVLKYDIHDQSAIMPSGWLDVIHAKDPDSKAMDLKARITKCKKNFDHGFYFLYVLQVDGTSTKQMEHATKDALKKVGIYTTADAKGGYADTTIELPDTPFVHDLWLMKGTRRITVSAGPAGK